MKISKSKIRGPKFGFMNFVRCRLLGACLFVRRLSGLSHLLGVVRLFRTNVLISLLYAILKGSNARRLAVLMKQTPPRETGVTFQCDEGPRGGVRQFETSKASCVPYGCS